MRTESCVPAQCNPDPSLNKIEKTLRNEINVEWRAWIFENGTKRTTVPEGSSRSSFLKSVLFFYGARALSCRGKVTARSVNYISVLDLTCSHNNDMQNKTGMRGDSAYATWVLQLFCISLLTSCGKGEDGSCHGAFDLYFVLDRWVWQHDCNVICLFVY